MFSEGADKVNVDGAEIYQMIFAHQVKVLALYKRIAELKNMQNEDPACTAEIFETQVKKYFINLKNQSLPPGSLWNNFSVPMTGYSVVGGFGVHKFGGIRSSKWKHSASLFMNSYIMKLEISCSLELIHVMKHWSPNTLV